MTDIVDFQTRSRMMSGIRGRDTKPELLLRRTLHALGFRYRLHGRKLPGRPDIVLPKYRAVIFVHGCFWHRHEGCKLATTPSTRREFWQGKFQENVARDQRNIKSLRVSDWRVAVVWQCDIEKRIGEVSSGLSAWLKSGEATWESDKALFEP